MFERNTTDELMQIVEAGGSFRLNADSRTTDELVQIAAAASRGGGPLILTGLNRRNMDEVLQITRAGRGRIRFE